MYLVLAQQIVWRWPLVLVMSRLHDRQFHVFVCGCDRQICLVAFPHRDFFVLFFFF